MSRVYSAAAKTVEAVIRTKRGIFSTTNKAGIVGKEEYLLATQTLKYRAIMDQIFASCSISAGILGVKLGLMYVMTFELLFGKQKINGMSKRLGG